MINSEAITIKYKSTHEAQPISGDQLVHLQELANSTPPAMNYFLGVSPHKLTQLKKAKPNEMDPRISLMTRYLLRYPEHVPSLNAPSAHDLFNTIKGILPHFTQEQFVRMLGYQTGAPGRLLKKRDNGFADLTTGKGNHPPATTSRYMLLIEQAITEDPQNIHEFIEIAEEEAKARGQDPHDMWRNGWRKFD